MGFGFTWRYVWRVLGVISLFAALAGPAWATFPATAIGWQFNSTQGYGCNGKATAAEACACKMTPVGGGGYGNYLVTMIGTKNATCEGRFGLTTYNYQTLISQSDLCPVNSTLGGSSCTCNQGFVELNANSVYSCVPAPFQISFNGATSTKALPAGSALQQTALVTQDGLIAPNKSVSISITGGGSISGVTDSTGQFFFNYLPPANAVVDTITGTCDGCANTATSQITVTSADAPNMCLNEAGTLVGNPIVPATGEKVETQLDWTDAGAHPLSLSRHYKSYGFGSALAGLGTYWSHNFAAGISGLATDNGRAVRLGDGTSVLFNRVNDTAPWTSNTAIDTLTSSPVGPVFTRASDESRWQFDALGKLVSVTQRNGWVMALAYTNGDLTSVTNQFGRSLQLAYDVQGRLTSVTTPGAQVLAYGFDAASRHNAVLYPDGKTKTYQYGHYLWPNALTGIVDENANSFASFEYDANGRAISTSHAGNAQKFSLDFGSANASPVGTLQAAPVPANSPLYKGSATVTTPLGGTQTLSFQGGDGSIRLLGSNSVFGSTLFASRGFDYPQAPTLPTLETDFLGTQTQFTWDTARRLQTSITQAANRPENQARSIQWHPSFRLPTQTMEPGRTTVFTYDAATGNKLSETITDTATGQARTWAWSYNAQGLVATSSDARGFVSTYSYDAAGNVTRFKNPLNQETLSTFDAAGRTLTQTQANGLLTTYTYDPRGRMLGMVHSGPGMAAEASTFSYTPSGQVATSTLPNGMAVAYRYDAAQRLVGATDNRGNTVDYQLDGMGNRLREEVKDPSGSIALLTTRVVNSLNRVSAIAAATGQTTQLAYDANGEPIQQTDPLNQTTRQTLDGLRRSTGTTFADNAQASQSWTALNQLAGVTDPKSVQTQYVRNAFGEVMSEASPDIGTLTYQRDAGGNVTHMTDAKGQTSQYTRDELGRVTQISFADGKTHQFNYDSVGNHSQLTDPSGTTTYSRDALGRVLQKTQTVADSPAVPSSYGLSYLYHPGGQVAQINYPSGLKAFYRRNAQGQIYQVDVQQPGATTAIVPFISNLTYTALGQPKTWIWNHPALSPNSPPTTTAASRSFDADGRMVSNEFASYSYDIAGRINGIVQKLDAARSVAGSNGSFQTIFFTTPLAFSIGYDSRDRITSFSRNGANQNYSYDVNGNRLSSLNAWYADLNLNGTQDATDSAQSLAQTTVLAAGSNRVAGFNQTQSQKTGGVTIQSSSQIPYSLDAAGNLTSDGLRQFWYDAQNRPSKATVSDSDEGSKITFLHNALGQRVFKSEPMVDHLAPQASNLGQSFVNWLQANFGWLFAQAQANATLGQSYLYDDALGSVPMLLGEYGNGGNNSGGRKEYLWLPVNGQAMPIGLYANTLLYAVQADHLNTPRKASQGSGPQGTVWQWPYSAFGDEKPIEGILRSLPATAIASIYAIDYATGTKLFNLPVAGLSLRMNLRFPGQYFDSETNLSYNYFRSYQPTQGRYTQFDPIGLAGGLNPYQYAGSNPLSNIDPNGLDIVVVTGGRREATNPFGHSAVGVTGAGLYSYGNGTSLGSSVTSYVASQSQYRNQQITIIPTSPQQDAAALQNLYGQGCKNCVGYVDNCAVRTNSALEAAGLRTGATGFPGSVARGAAGLPGAQTYTVPQGGPIPQPVIDALRRFTPPNVP